METYPKKKTEYAVFEAGEKKTLHPTETFDFLNDAKFFIKVMEDGEITYDIPVRTRKIFKREVQYGKWEPAEGE